MDNSLKPGGKDSEVTTTQSLSFESSAGMASSETSSVAAPETDLSDLGVDLSSTPSPVAAGLPPKKTSLIIRRVASDQSPKRLSQRPSSLHSGSNPPEPQRPAHQKSPSNEPPFGLPAVEDVISDDDDQHIQGLSTLLDQLEDDHGVECESNEETLEMKALFLNEERFWELFYAREESCVAYANDVNDHCGYFDRILPDLDENSNKKFASYRASVRAVVNEGPAAELCKDFSFMLGQINAIQLTLTNSIRKQQRIQEEVRLRMKEIESDAAQFHAAARQHKKLQRKYFGLKKDAPQSEIDKTHDQYSKHKNELARLRFARDARVQQFFDQRALTMMRQLVFTVEAYTEFFKAGYKLVTPMDVKIGSMHSLIAQEKDRIAAREAQRKLVQKQLRKLGADISEAIAHERPSTAAGGARADPCGTGVRDLDRDLSGDKHTTATLECEGMLFLPPPVNEAVWCSIEKSMFVIHYRDKLGVQKKVRDEIPLLLSTVKENRDLKFRFAFSLVSVQSSMTFQAETQAEMNRWMTIIQNAISQQLESQTGRGDEGEDAHAKRNTELLDRLAKIPGNDECAECGAKEPDWCAINLGILLCLDCSGLHRNLGVHISKVRSVTLDKLDHALVQYFELVGNIRSNELWEGKILLDANLLRKKKEANKSRVSREMFIRAKYEHKSFLAHVPSENPVDAHTLLYDAARTGHTRVLDILKALALGGDCNWKHPEENDQSALHVAAKNGCQATVECLLQNDANVRAVDGDGWLPLFHAVSAGNLDIVQQLLHKGGSTQVLHKDHEGRTALDLCLELHSECPLALVLKQRQAEAEVDVIRRQSEDAYMLSHQSSLATLNLASKDKKKVNVMGSKAQALLSSFTSKTKQILGKANAGGADGGVVPRRPTMKGGRRQGSLLTPEQPLEPTEVAVQADPKSP